MLTLSRTNDQFGIVHVSKYTGRQIVYSFPLNFLPGTTIRHVNALGIFLQNEVTYVLNPTYDLAVSEVLQKLHREQHSTYIFSHHLQKTYLMEFIHLITKWHLHKSV
jgi:hypothetical protein